MMVWSSLLLIKGDLLKFACSKMYHIIFCLFTQFSMVLLLLGLIILSTIWWYSQLPCLQYQSLAQMLFWSQWQLMSLSNPWARRSLRLRLYYLIRLELICSFLPLFCNNLAILPCGWYGVHNLNYLLTFQKKKIECRCACILWLNLMFIIWWCYFW